MKRMRFILALLAVLLLGAGCQKEPDLVVNTEGRGSVIFKLTSQDPVRLKTKTPADDLLDGLRFENILVILVDNSNNVVGNVYKEYPYDPTDPGNDSDQEEVQGSSTTNDVIHFDHLNPGNYTAYAYANIDAEAWQKSGEEISASGQEKAKTSGDFTSFIARELKTASPAPVTPSNASETSMLLTGKVSVPVGLSVETHIIYLKRPVVRFRVFINNSTPYSVRVDDLRFSHFNADRAYLVDHCDESGVPSLPDGVTYGALPAYPILHAPSLETAPPSGSPGYQEEYPVYETLLYENASPNSYKVFATLTLDPSGLNKQMSLGQREFGIVDYETLSDLDDGEVVDVLMINPRSSTRSGRLYYGIGTAKKISWESCGYTSYAKFFARAQAIYNETNPFTYEGFSYTGPANNKSGIAGWTGNTLEDPLTEITSFNYSGARSRYFRRITKSGNLYSIDGLAINPASETSISGMRIDQGVNVSGKFASDIKGNWMVQFINNDSGEYLKSDCVWNSGNSVENAKNSKLVWETFTNGNRQDYQFLLFGKFCAGGILKRILKDSHKEVPLSYMSRNEDIKLVINVYFADQEGTLNFDVDNSTWTSRTESSHAFN